MPELKGLVLETFGAGNAPAAGGADCRLTAVLEEAIGKRGIVIVSVTQCLHGTVQQALYESGTALAKVGVVSGLDMTSEAALTKLAYLLALPELSGGRDGIGNTKHIAQLMATSLRGELTESAPTAFQHPLAHGQGGGGSDGNIINNVIGNSNGNDITRPALSMPAYLEPRVARLTKLGYAIGEGDLEGVKEILAFEGGRNECLVNDVDYSGNTPLVSKDNKTRIKNIISYSITHILSYRFFQGHLWHSSQMIHFCNSACSISPPRPRIRTRSSSAPCSNGGHPCTCGTNEQVQPITTERTSTTVIITITTTVATTITVLINTIHHPLFLITTAAATPLKATPHSSLPLARAS